MYTQITVQAKGLRAGDVLVGRGATVSLPEKRTEPSDHVRVTVRGSAEFEFLIYAPTAAVRVVREVRP